MANKPNRPWVNGEPVEIPHGFISSEQAAAMLGMSDASLRAMRARPAGQDRGPLWVNIGARVLYRPSDIRAWDTARVSKLRARAATIEARANGSGVVYLESDEAPRGFVRADDVPNPAAAQAAHVKAELAKRREPEPWETVEPS